MTNALRR